MENIEETIGYQLAISFKPFIDPMCTEHMEIVKDMAKAINKHIPNQENTFHERDIINAVKMARKLPPEMLSTDILEAIKITKN